MNISYLVIHCRLAVLDYLAQDLEKASCGCVIYGEKTKPVIGPKRGWISTFCFTSVLSLSDPSEY